jgi:hypothetical protein
MPVLKIISAGEHDAYAIITYNNGSIAKQEFYYGNSFLSQSARFMQVDDGMKSVVLVDNKGNRRVVNFNSLPTGGVRLQ